MSDLARMADDVVASVREFVARAIAGVTKRIDELSEMAAALDRRIGAIPAGAPGKDAEVDYARVGELVSSMVSAAVKALPVPQNGKDAEVDVDSIIARIAAGIPTPRDGKDADPVDYDMVVSKTIELATAAMTQSVDRQMTQAIALLPKKEDVTLPDIGALVDAAVLKAVAAIPKAKDGERGKDGESVHPDTVQLMLVKEVDRHLSLWPRPKDGEKGKDGTDGLGFDDLSVEYDGERTFTLKFQRGEQCKEFSFKVPIVIDRGVFKSEKAYERNDGVTYGGSWHIALKDAPEGKPGFGGDWRLAVKRGQDGKDLTPAKAEPPQVVRIR